MTRERLPCFGYKLSGDSYMELLNQTGFFFGLALHVQIKQG